MSPYFIENLFGIEGFSIRWYGIIMGASILAGTLLSVCLAKKRGISPDLFLDFLFFALPMAIIGARLYYVIFEWDYYSRQPLKIFAVWEGGIALYGSLIGGFLAAVLFCRRRRLSLPAFLDLIIPGLVLGQVIGRYGNFTNQEAYGRLITNPNLQFFPYGVYIEELKEWHQATFFYESLWNFFALCFLLFLFHKTTKPGVLTASYFILYGTGRFLIENLRSDSLTVAGNIRVSAVLSLVLIAFGLLFFFFLFFKKSKYQKN